MSLSQRSLLTIGAISVGLAVGVPGFPGATIRIDDPGNKDIKLAGNDRLEVTRGLPKTDPDTPGPLALMSMPAVGYHYTEQPAAYGVYSVRYYKRNRVKRFWYRQQRYSH